MAVVKPGQAKGGGWDAGGEDGSEEWEKDYGELYESTSAMVQRKAQWKWTAAITGHKNGLL